MQVIETGRHENRKDEYKEEYRAWNYAIRGETLDGRALRVAVSFERVSGEDLMVLVTAIDLDRSN